MEKLFALNICTKDLPRRYKEVGQKTQGKNGQRIMNKSSTKGNIHVVDKYVFTSLIIREMQIKNAILYTFTEMEKKGKTK